MAYHFNNRIEIIEKQHDFSSPEPDAPRVNVTIAKPYADIKTLRGSEYMTMIGDVVKQPIRFIIRYRDGIKTHHIVKYNGKEYKIESLANDDGKNHTITIFASSLG
ncbi:head-tail adaptor protein [Staphylococcus felis]|uniref:Phage head closure protein n=1 Tax=Staphylococcus felis TaxID=46127 RepID=A0ABS0QNW1_9STAP|nr:phage head closure protein [Staphylococcus felis]MBH9580368.1 phage head closure protein [Staphylococcus felis]REH74464.1 head-tail adaptor protein [Staphylococcus felis]REH87171.1 head-tail adaptor protein [Staphylococcus felis]REH97334.1 head-tail adaptor protein [Staphylococcus felis]REI28476.1 head-tail adaptor protein [Staphylococcus felis]